MRGAAVNRARHRTRVPSPRVSRAACGDSAAVGDSAAGGGEPQDAAASRTPCARGCPGTKTIVQPAVRAPLVSVLAQPVKGSA